MKRLRIIRAIFKRTHSDRILFIYLVWFFISSFIVTCAEPGITTISDGIWFCFSSVTTIGYGDLTAITFIGRFFIIILSIYSLFVFAILSAVMTSYFLDLAQINANQSIEEFLYDLKHLPELSQERLQEISFKVTEFEKRNKKSKRT